jgi:hypothetical protein
VCLACFKNAASGYLATPPEEMRIIQRFSFAATRNTVFKRNFLYKSL